jgi:RNA polymerase sigma-70 factor (ECF subfamily)
LITFLRRNPAQNVEDPEAEQEKRAFLLNALPEADRERFEERLLEDEEFFVSVVAAEQELLDEHASGLLPSSVSKHIDRVYNSSPVRAQRARIAQTMRQAWRPSIRVERRTFDGDYVQRLVDGDSSTEANFVEYFDPLLTRKLRSRLRSAALIEEVKQETFLRLFRALRERGGFENPASLGAYVDAVCNNVLFETHRRMEANQPSELSKDLVSNEQDIYSEMISRENTAWVRRILSELPAKDREILKQLFFEQRDKDAVCREMGIDQAYLRNLLFRVHGKAGQ